MSKSGTSKDGHPPCPSFPYYPLYLVYPLTRLPLLDAAARKESAVEVMAARAIARAVCQRVDPWSEEAKTMNIAK